MLNHSINNNKYYKKIIYINIITIYWIKITQKISKYKYNFIIIIIIIIIIIYILIKIFIVNPIIYLIYPFFFFFYVFNIYT